MRKVRLSSYVVAIAAHRSAVDHLPRAQLSRRQLGLSCFNCFRDVAEFGNRSFKLLRLRDTKCALLSRRKQSVRQPSHFGSNSQPESVNGFAASVGRIGSTNAGIGKRRAAAWGRFCFLWATPNGNRFDNIR